MSSSTTEYEKLAVSVSDEEGTEDVREAEVIETLRDHASRPRNMGSLPNPDGVAVITGDCTDTVAVAMRVEDNRVLKASFMAQGCGFTRACGSMATTLAEGKTLNDVLQITGDIIAAELGGLPDDHLHCALLASNALRAAARDALQNRNAPWRRLYR